MTYILEIAKCWNPLQTK